MTKQNFKTDLQAVKFLIKQSGSSTWQLEKLTGISRQTFDRWKKADSLEVRSTTMQDFAEKLGYRVERNYNGIAVSPHNKEETGVLTMNQQNMLIEYQQKEIAELKERVAKHKSTPIQATVWDSLEYDYSVDLSITFKNFKMGRTVLKVNNIDRICDVLGYSKQEVLDFWDIGTLYTDFTAHPIDKILTKDTKKDIKSKVKALPNIFEALKDMLGNHYIPTPITYICKDKSFVHSISYNKVDWKNKIVESKVQFLLNE
jgi:hypothetical protein